MTTLTYWEAVKLAAVLFAHVVLRGGCMFIVCPKTKNMHFVALEGAPPHRVLFRQDQMPLFMAHLRQLRSNRNVKP